MSDVLFYSPVDTPAAFMGRAADAAATRGEVALASLFAGFADIWDSEPAAMGFGVSQPAATWREAKVSQIGRAALVLASEFTDIKSSEDGE